MRSGLPVESIDPLPEYKGETISADGLVKTLRQAEESGCKNSDDTAILTMIDFRDLGALKQKTGGDCYKIKTSCPILTFHLDDLLYDEILRNSIPKNGKVFTISETGNRDLYLQRYLYKYGYTNIISLEHGMRAWLKAGYPSEKLPLPPQQRSEE